MAKRELIIAIEADPDDPEDFPVSTEALEKSLAERRERRAGRPRGSLTSAKQQVTLRLDRDTIDRFKAGGPGWQTRINEALRRLAP